MFIVCVEKVELKRAAEVGRHETTTINVQSLCGEGGMKRAAEVGRHESLCGVGGMKSAAEVGRQEVSQLPYSAHISIDYTTTRNVQSLCGEGGMKRAAEVGRHELTLIQIRQRLEMFIVCVEKVELKRAAEVGRHEESHMCGEGGMKRAAEVGRHESMCGEGGMKRAAEVGRHEVSQLRYSAHISTD
ncbi:hypothetical protein J6590_034108 [Homalodisca vitripennis]|nr:hypothetical protein J6590_034108 [Homalodisca vitripennis]